MGGGGWNFGAEGRTRTADTYIFSVVLYRLSYLGTIRILATPTGGGQAVAGEYTVLPRGLKFRTL